MRHFRYYAETFLCGARYFRHYAETFLHGARYFRHMPKPSCVARDTFGTCRNLHAALRDAAW